MRVFGPLTIGHHQLGISAAALSRPNLAASGSSCRCRFIIRPRKCPVRRQNLFSVGRRFFRRPWVRSRPTDAAGQVWLRSRGVQRQDRPGAAEQIGWGIRSTPDRLVRRPTSEAQRRHTCRLQSGAVGGRHRLRDPAGGPAWRCQSASGLVSIAATSAPRLNPSAWPCKGNPAARRRQRSACFRPWDRHLDRGWGVAGTRGFDDLPHSRISGIFEQIHHFNGASPWGQHLHDARG